MLSKAEFTELNGGKEWRDGKIAMRKRQLSGRGFPNAIEEQVHRVRHHGLAGGEAE
jgi:hypothetical protein